MTHSAEVLDTEPALQARERSRRRTRTTATSARRMISGASLVLGGTMFGQASNFVFNAVGAHDLGPARYGVLAATLALVNFATPLLAALQAVASREATSLTAGNESWKIAAMLRHYGLRVGVASLVLGGAVAAASGWISGVFHLGSPWFAVLVGVTIPCYMVGHLLGGVLQGIERFGRFALESVVEGSTKAIIGILGMGLLWRSALSGMATVSASCAAGLAAYLVLVLPVLDRSAPKSIAAQGRGEAGVRSRGAHRRHPRAGVPGVLRYSVTALVTYGLLALMLSSDTLVAKHYLSSHQAGLYAGISLAGKIAYFATSALFVIAFPIFSRQHDHGIRSIKSLLVTGAAVCGTAGGILAMYILKPAWVVIPLLGDRYRPAEGHVSWMAAVFGLYALGCLLSVYLLAHKRRGIIAVLAVAVVVQFTGFFGFHSTIAGIMSVLAVAFGVLLAGGTLLVLLDRGRETQARSRRVVRDRPRRVGASASAMATGAAPGVIHSNSDPCEAWREQIVTEIARHVGRAPVLLAGSRALGTAHANSDYDLSVVLPVLRIPRAAPRLAMASAQLSVSLGVPASVNPVPRFRMRWPGGSLFIRKLQAEAIVLGAPPGWSLRRQPLTAVTDFAASSALLSAVQSLLRGFDTSAMRGDPPPLRMDEALRKAALHVAQVKLLRAGCYVSDLESALARLRCTPPSGRGEVSGAELAAALIAGLSMFDKLEGFLRLRECILRQLAEVSDSPFSLPLAKSMVRNLQYVALARLHGRNRWRVALRRPPVEAALAATQLALLRALDPRAVNGMNEVQFRIAKEEFPVSVAAVGTLSWEELCDLTLAEWADAHPLAGVLA